MRFWTLTRKWRNYYRRRIVCWWKSETSIWNGLQRLVWLREQDERKEKAERRQHAKLQLQQRTCDICDRVFPNQHAKQQHYNAVHGFECNTCGKSFFDQHSLYQHQDALDHFWSFEACFKHSLVLINIALPRTSSRTSLAPWGVERRSL